MGCARPPSCGCAGPERPSRRSRTWWACPRPWWRATAGSVCSARTRSPRSTISTRTNRNVRKLTRTYPQAKTLKTPHSLSGKGSRYHRGHLDECDDLELAPARQGRRRDSRIRQITGVALKRRRRGADRLSATASLDPPCDKSARFELQARRHSLVDRRDVHLFGNRSPVIVGVVDARR